MKVRPEPQPSAARTESTASGARNNKKSDADNQDTSTSARGADFASILDAVSGPPDEQSAKLDGRQELDNERRSSGRSQAEARRVSESSQDELRETEKRSVGQGGQHVHKPLAKTKDQHGGDEAEQAGAAGQQTAAAPATEAALETEIPGARAIITDSDLSSIVSTIRADMTYGGRREVVIELSHSVLEGLRIRIGSDAFGRVRAEFIATSEQVKAQLDHRTHDLADLLRARGINLTALKTTLERDHSGNAAPGDDRRGRARGEPAPVAVERKSRRSSSGVDGEAVESDSTSESLKNYRA